MYLYLMGSIFQEKHQRRRTNDRLLDFDFLNWPIIYKNNYYCILKAKLRCFQIKLHLQAIVSNSQLFGFGLVENYLCTFCKRASEAVLHLFCTCVYVLKFWDYKSSWLSHHFMCNIILNNFIELLGFQHFEPSAKTNLLNCRLFEVKFSVFTHRCSNTKPEIESYLYSIRVTNFTEYINAKHTGILYKHYLK